MLDAKLLFVYRNAHAAKNNLMESQTGSLV